MGVRHIAGGRVAPIVGIMLAWLAVAAAWLASAPAALAARQVFRLTDVAQDPRILAIGTLLLAAAWLGFAGRRRRGPRHR